MRLDISILHQLCLLINRKDAFSSWLRRDCDQNLWLRQVNFLDIKTLKQLFLILGLRFLTSAFMHVVESDLDVAFRIDFASLSLGSVKALDPLHSITIKFNRTFLSQFRWLARSHPCNQCKLLNSFHLSQSIASDVISQIKQAARLQQVLLLLIGALRFHSAQPLLHRHSFLDLHTFAECLALKTALFHLIQAFLNGVGESSLGVLLEQRVHMLVAGQNRCITIELSECLLQKLVSKQRFATITHDFRLHVVLSIRLGKSWFSATVETRWNGMLHV